MEIGRLNMVKNGGDRTSGEARSLLTVAVRSDRPTHSTREEIAKAAGTSTAQVSRYDVVAKKSPSLLQEALDGKITINAAYLEVKNDEKKTARAVPAPSAAFNGNHLRYSPKLASTFPSPWH